MSALEVVALVVGILLLQVVLWIPIAKWMRRRTAELNEALRAELEGSGEVVVLGPTPDVYRGSSAGHTKVKGNAVIALTERRVVFARLVGERVEVPMAEVTGLREDKWFLRAYTGGRPHVILQLGERGEVGFFVNDHAQWMQTLGERIARQPTQSV